MFAAYCLLLTVPVVIDDFDDRRERDFNDLPVGAFDLNAGRRQRLSRLHAAHDAAHADAIARHDFNVAFAVKRLQRCQSFRHFHCLNGTLIDLGNYTC